MKNRALQYLLLAIVTFTVGALLHLSTPAARAQENSLTIQLDWPAEGETVYAGPSSLAYTVPVMGWVQGFGSAASNILVKLELFEDQALTRSLSQPLGADGYFEFLLTVNPDGSDGFFPAEHLACADLCHYRAEDSFPAGSMRLHISVKEEGTGQEATIERNITVDRSSQAQIPVEVRLAGESYQTVPGVAVMGSTRLYLWRQRNASGVSDDNGIALLNVEVLSEKPTHYIFRAVPSIVDGLLYEAADSVELELAPGATTSEPIIVTVTRSTGQIQGVLSSGENIIPDDLAVIAIQLPFGASFRSELTSDKVFKFEDIPIDRYLIAFDNEALGDADLRVNPQGVDLVNGTGLSVSAPVQAIEGAKLRGQITDENNFPLPFAWISVEGMNSTAAAYPGTDGYSLAGLPDETITMVAHAPGHYSQAMVVHPDSVSPTNLSFTLKPDEDTEAISWEDGVLTLPSESDIELSGDQVLFRRGWIWGNSGGAANGDASVNDILPKHIRVAGKDIELGKADFSIEFLPGEQAWLFVSEGEVKLRPIGGEETIIVSAGSMANLLHGGQVQSVPMDPVVIAALHSDATAQINPNWEPTLKAQIRDRLARLGVGSAQVVTFVTYFFVLLGVLVIPLSAVYLWWGRRS